MPYVKNSVKAGVKDSIEIVSYFLDLEGRVIHCNIRETTIDIDGIPRVQSRQLSICNNDNDLIPDPQDPEVMIIDPAKQYFDIALTMDYPGSSLYERTKFGLYTIMESANLIPSSTDGWSIQ
jgi:hypothetical protein